MIITKKWKCASISPPETWTSTAEVLIRPSEQTTDASRC